MLVARSASFQAHIHPPCSIPLRSIRSSSHVLVALLERAGLPTRAPNRPRSAYLSAIAVDKKKQGGKIKVDGAGRTTRAGVWAGGDCASGGDDQAQSRRP